MRGNLKAGSTLVFEGYEYEHVMQLIDGLDFDCQWRQAGTRIYVWLRHDGKGGRFYMNGEVPAIIPDASYDMKGRKLGQGKAWGLGVSRYEENWSSKVERFKMRGEYLR